MTTKVRIGTCGFGLSKVDYARLFSSVEVQNTFYQPPQIATLERWRQGAAPSFEFTLKAWQLITHEARSPTYRRLKKKLTEIEIQEAGFFKPTQIVKEAWEVTRVCAEALKATAILFQCPASFTPTKENIFSLERFFSSIPRTGVDLCWEPRGAWDKDLIRSICSELKLSHVVDPFIAKTVTPNQSYFRLHGRTGWRYQYEEGELRELAAMLPKRKSARVFFNNVSMTKDALRFQAMMAEAQ